MRALLAFLFIAAGIGHATAQATGGVDGYIFSARHYGTAQGLPHRGANSIAQDRRGFLWVATQMGVARFDGYTFVNHTRADGLSMDLVKTVLCDADGLLWLWHPDGNVNILDPETGQCRTFNAHFGERVPFPNGGAIRGLCAGNDGTIAFHQAGHLVRYRGAKANFELLPLACAGVLRPWYIEPDGDLLCHCAFGSVDHGDLLHVPAAAWLQHDTSGIRRIASVTGLPDIGHDLFDAPTTVEGGVYFYTDGGHAWLSASEELKLIGSSDTASVLASATGSMYLPLGAEHWLVDRTVRSMRPGDDGLSAPVLFDMATLFPGTRHGLNDALRDRMGNIWIGGDFGLFKLTLRPDHVQRWLYDDDPVAAVGVNVRGMAFVGGQLHVNTQETGRWILDPDNGHVLRSWSKKEDGLAIVGDGQGGLWRAYGSWLVHSRADGTDDRFVEMVGAYGGWSLMVLTPDRVLVGTDRGLRLEANGQLRTLVHPLYPELDESSIWHMRREEEDRILCCTSAGIYLINAVGDVLDHWGPDPPPVNGISHRLPAEDIRHFHVDTAGIHWLATAAQGLVRWDRRTGESRTIGAREGIPTTSIHAVYADDLGTLWLPTDNGLVRYDPTNGQVKIFTTADGITNNEFNRIAHVQGSDGRMYFGGFNGITVVHPARLRAHTSTHAAHVELTAVHLQPRDSTGLADLTAAVRNGTTIVVHPGDRFFTVGMALLNYDDPAQIRYAWRIDGVDKDWNTQAEPHLRFTTLPYGEHVLRIKAMDADARWSVNELTIPIVVVRPVYLRWWFFALVALAMAGLIYAVFRYRLQQLRKVIRVRDRIAMDLHDEVGSNLSGIVLFSSAVSKSANDLPQKAADMLHRISDNSTRAMESMNDIVWSVNSQHDQLGDVLDRMRAYAQPLCETANIELSFDAAPALHQRKLGMEERKSLYLIFKEAVSNAVRHAQCSRITVTLREDGKRIELLVQDNGIGLPAPPATDGTLGGNGLGNMQRRAASVGGELELQPRGTGGTVLLLRIPTGHG